jgi:pimeloyl-ACP methyl ester carboxylesterase
VRRALLVVLVLLLTGCGGGQTAHHTSRPTPSVAASSPSCQPLVLGFRGQGQSTRGFHGAGREAGQVGRKMAERLAARVVGVRFPSSAGGSTYDADVAAGVRLAGRLIGSACGPVVLVGYSQGAEVAHRVAVAHPRRVALVVLMGDPLRDPADRVHTLTLGTGALTGRGNGGPYARFPSVVRPRVLEVCVRSDDVCNAPLTGRVGPPSATHRSAYQGDGAVRRIVGAAS